MLLCARHLMPILLCRVAKSLGPGVESDLGMGSDSVFTSFRSGCLFQLKSYLFPWVWEGHSLTHQSRGRPGKCLTAVPQGWGGLGAPRNLPTHVEQGVSVSQDVCHLLS